MASIVIALISGGLLLYALKIKKVNPELKMKPGALGNFIFISYNDRATLNSTDSQPLLIITATFRDRDITNLLQERVKGLRQYKIHFTREFIQDLTQASHSSSSLFSPSRESSGDSSRESSGDSSRESSGDSVDSDDLLIVQYG